MLLLLVTLAVFRVGTAAFAISNEIEMGVSNILSIYYLFALLLPQSPPILP
jgi:hypothetical protein